MEGTNILSKIKKYFFFISVLFLIITWFHLSYTFIYNDSKDVAEKWGRVIEWVIWNFPHLNPLRNTNDYNDTINHMLYRSLLSYNIAKKEIQWDIANCDILSNSLTIECSINDNAIWSNWDKITYNDIYKTYLLLKETDVNTELKQILKYVEIDVKESSIVFRNTKKDSDWYLIEDINILNIFFQPILPSTITNNLDSNSSKDNISPIDWIYSWKYILTKISEDKSLGITKLFLEKNDLYKNNPVYIENYIFYVFKDLSHFLKNKNTVNIFKDKNNLIADSIPKLKEYKYNLNKYSNLFLNTLKITDKNIRAIILRAIDYDRLKNELSTNNFKIIKSPFLNELELIPNVQNNNLNKILEKRWYYNKNEIIKKLSKNIDWKLKNTYSNETILDKDNSISNKKIILNDSEKITINNYLVKSKIITFPDWVDNYNFITKNTLILKWKVDKNVTDVYFNDYKLENFNLWDSQFIYKVNNSSFPIKLWENLYKIYFVKNWKKELKEEVNIFYNPDKSTHKKYLDELLITLNTNKLKEKIWKIEKTNIWELNKEENNKYKKILDSFKNLDSKFYYNKDLKPYSLNLTYISENETSDKSADFIKNELENIWIKINLQGVSINQFLETLENWEKNYDIFIWNINLWYFNFNLFPYLHSSQIRNFKKFNLSNFTTKKTDILTEDLKKKILSKEKTQEKEKELIEILQKESVMKPLYSPYYRILIDKNIEWYEINNNIPYDKYLFDPFIKSYITKKRIINYDDKSISKFFKYLINSLL